MIPFGNLKKHYFLIKDEIDSAILEVLESGWFILGERVSSFEKKFANYCDKEFGIGVGSGTDALLLSLLAYGINQGDEVITVPNTAIPTISAIIASGARPVFVDINENYLIDVDKIEAAITPKTKAIVPVHLYGQACDMNRVIELANKYNLAIIEDCAQSHGAKHNGKKVPISETGAFSFYPSKNLGAFGDAGMVVTGNKNIANKLKKLRNYGQSDRYYAESQGYNSRLSDIQAAILDVKLKYLDKWNERRQNIAETYDLLLKELVKTPLNQNGSRHVYHLYVVRHEKREELQKYLEKRGIKTIIHYPIPLHLQPAYRYLGYNEGDFPNTEKFCKEILSIPIFPELEDEEVKKIVEVIKEFS